jgi:hypothetical protein
MDLTDNERDLILAGLFELTITYAEDDEKRERCKALARSSAAIREQCSTRRPSASRSLSRHVSAHGRSCPGGGCGRLFLLEMVTGVRSAAVVAVGQQHRSTTSGSGGSSPKTSGSPRNSCAPRVGRATRQAQLADLGREALRDNRREW